MNTISFPKMFNNNKNKMNLSLSTNTKSIHESLTSLLMTNPGELLGDPKYGCGLRNKLFDIKYHVDMFELRTIIINAIEKYVPSIKVNTSNIKIYSDANNNHYKITINYQLQNDVNINDYELII